MLKDNTVTHENSYEQNEHSYEHENPEISYCFAIILQTSPSQTSLLLLIKCSRLAWPHCSRRAIRKSYNNR
jgi:hypothetical protein